MEIFILNVESMGCYLLWTERGHGKNLAYLCMVLRGLSESHPQGRTIVQLVHYYGLCEWAHVHMICAWPGWW